MPIAIAELSNTLSHVVETVGRSLVRLSPPGRTPFTGVAFGPHHVVTSARSLRGATQVQLSLDGAHFAARLAGIDHGSDVALLETDATLTPATFDERVPKVGELALQLGRPGETVRATSGIVMTSAVKAWRTPHGAELERYLESDAPFQPGFTGGPLVDLEGRVLGLTTTALVRGSSVTIPSITVRRVATQLQQHGRVRESWLGLKLQPVALSEKVRAETGEEVGLLVIDVDAGGPAEKAGVTSGDTVLHLGDAEVKTFDGLLGWLKVDREGQAVPMKVLRGGQVEQRTVTLGAR
jgi:S1-C subfamily serine protease